MTDRLDDGGPAFPRPDWNGSWSGPDSFTGMTLRDMFAIHALVCIGGVIPSDDAARRRRADLAYKQADAMLEARKVKS